MRKAYGGRAAAYEKKGDFENALADHKMVVLYYTLEAEILTSLDAPDRGKFLADTALAYKARSTCALMGVGPVQGSRQRPEKGRRLGSGRQKAGKDCISRKESSTLTVQIQNGLASTGNHGDRWHILSPGKRREKGDPRSRSQRSLRNASGFPPIHGDRASGEIVYDSADTLMDVLS